MATLGARRGNEDSGLEHNIAGSGIGSIADRNGDGRAGRAVGIVADSIDGADALVCAGGRPDVEPLSGADARAVACIRGHAGLRDAAAADDQGIGRPAVRFCLQCREEGPIGIVAELNGPRIGEFQERRGGFRKVEVLRGQERRERQNERKK